MLFILGWTARTDMRMLTLDAMSAIAQSEKPAIGDRFAESRTGKGSVFK